MSTSRGQPAPLGATATAGGVNFALFSENASGVELCLFDSANRETRIPLTARTHAVWHALVSGVGVGTRYAYRVSGPSGPGLHFVPEHTVLCPYARAVEMLGASPVGVVTESRFDWQNDAPPAHAFADLVIYETHVCGLTKRHPGVPEALRGTYGGLSAPATLDYLRDLGVNAVELLPVHRFIDDPFLQQRGLRNYWGYSTLGFSRQNRATVQVKRGPARSTNSKRWCARSTPPASKCCSMSSTITRAKATTPALRSAFAASTTLRTTDCRALTLPVT